LRQPGIQTFVVVKGSRREMDELAAVSAAAVPATAAVPKPTQAERDAVKAEIEQLVATKKGSMNPVDLIGWAKLIDGIDKDQLTSSQLASIADVVARAAHPERFPPRNKDNIWKMTHDWILLNEGLGLMYSMNILKGFHTVNVIDFARAERVELVRESPHFAKERVISVFESIVQSHLGHEKATK